MICNHCGAELPEDGICPVCGGEPVTAVFHPKGGTPDAPEQQESPAARSLPEQEDGQAAAPDEPALPDEQEETAEPAPEEQKPGILHRLKELLLGRKLVLPAILLMLILAVGIAAAARYAKHSQSASSAQVERGTMNRVLETLLPDYGAVPTDVPLYAADAAGVIAAYIPAEDEMVLCRIAGKDLIAEHYEISEAGEVSCTDTQTFPDIFAAAYASAEQAAVIRAEQKGITVDGQLLMELKSAPAESISIAVIRLREKSRSWELSSFEIRDFTAFRSEITVPEAARKIELPDLTGMTWEEASNRVERLGLTAEQELAEHEGTERGTVFAQSPQAGAMLTQGNAVYLSVAADGFLFRYTPPEQAAGSFTVILYNNNGTELARGKWSSTDGTLPVPCFVAGLKHTETAEFQAVLCNDENGETAALGTYVTGADASAEADADTLQFAFAHIGGLRQETETTAPPEQSQPDEPAETPEWKRLYRAYLEDGLAGGFSQYHQSSFNCTLVYLDDDDIPEMIVGAVEDNRRISWICSVSEGAVHESGKLGGSFRYLERENRIFSETRTGYYAGHLIQTLEQGELKTLQSFEERWSKADDYSYKMDARTVDRAEYTEALQKAFTDPGGTEWNYAGSGWTLTEQNMENHLS
ncbi:MAG: PASTA domain-containing protein [Oscillospiraceae bacterium]|nr:PASTA domain-containing protein [Oscillospiraceae bacterium]